MIYLASPYSHPSDRVRLRRYEAAVEAIACIAKRGLHVYSPIVHWHQAAEDFDLPKDHEWRLGDDREHIDASSEVWVLKIGGYEESRGVAAEVNYATERGIPVRYVTVDELGEA